MKLPTDSQQRTTALDPRRSFIVQAPAGSGKTGLLVRRYLTLLACVETPEEILAITFTRKATAEMRQRIIAALALADRPEDDPSVDQELYSLAIAARENDARYQWQLDRHPSRMRIQTIDSLCNELVHRMPWSARFGTTPRILEAPTAHYQAAAAATLQHIEGEASSPHTQAARQLLLLVDANFHLGKQLLMEMLAQRDKWMRLLRRPDREQVEGWWRSTVEDILAQCSQALTESVKSEIAALASIGADNLIEAGKDGPLTVCTGLQSFPPADAGHLDIWLGISAMLITANGKGFRKTIDARSGFPAKQKDTSQRIKALLSDLAGNQPLEQLLVQVGKLPQPGYRDGQWRTLSALLQLLPVAVAELKLQFRETGETDYIELAQRAQFALGGDDGPSDLALIYDYQLKHLLMDEFQDTSAGQIELLKGLLEGWQADDGRTAFFVGDPMQSIYRFREAEVGNFLNTQQSGIADIKPTSLTLSSNFRSTSNLVQWFNHAFTEVMPKENDILQSAVRYCAAEPYLDPGPGSGVTVHPLVDIDIETEASNVAALVDRLGRENPAQSIAILGRTRNSLYPVANALKRRGIEYQAGQLQRLEERQSAQDLLNLAYALIEPADRVAWISLLRSPWCGLDLIDTTRLCERETAKPLIAFCQQPEFFEQLSEPGQQRLSRLLGVMQKAMGRCDRIAVWQNLQATWIALGGPATVDPGDLTDCHRLIHLIRGLEKEEASLSRGTIAKALDRLWAGGEQSATVQLLTIHAAKGLEFEIVILVDLDGRSRGINRELIRFKAFPDRLLMAARPASGESDTRLYDYLGKIEKGHQHYELTRLLYVACTRAQQQLHLFGKVKTNDKDQILPPPEITLLGILWPVVKADFEKSGTDHDLTTVKTMKTGSVPNLAVDRLPLDWRLPEILPRIPAVSAAVQTVRIEANSVIEFSWASETARLCGIVIHQVFRQVDTLGWADWQLHIQRPQTVAYWKNQLIEHGLAKSQLTIAIDHIQAALNNASEDPVAEWIFSTTHSEIHTEWPINGLYQGKIAHSVIDRSFVDPSGVRWIIDFKFSRHEDSTTLARFLEQERIRYHDKMHQYSEILGVIQPLPVKAALYYPSLKRLVKMD